MPRRALEITAEICGALEFSHRHGIIHRDIKPGNVMLTQTGQVKVMDFGIARALASGAATMTQTSAVIGTAQYLSPEQARGESVDARSDVYATGCVLYELLCGHPPFVGDSPVSVAYQHVREDPKPPSLSNRDVPPPVDAVVLKALAKNPVNRYQSAGEMRADLLRAAAGRPVYAEPVMRESDTGAGATRIVPPGGRPMPARVGNQQRRSTSGWAIAALSALAVLAVVALVAGLIIWQQPDKVSVPDLVGKTSAEAKELITGAGLEPVERTRTGTDCPAGQVESQDPSANTTVNQGSRVEFTLCLGPGQRQVPNVINLSRADAEAEITRNGLVPKVVEVESEKPKDSVIGTNPTVGSPVDEGSTVELQISLNNLRVVPNVSNLGHTFDVAKALIVAAGFDPNRVKPVVQNTNDPGKNGIVLQQTPAADDKRDPAKTTVELFVGQYISPTPTTTVSPPP